MNKSVANGLWCFAQFFCFSSKKILNLQLFAIHCYICRPYVCIELPCVSLAFNNYGFRERKERKKRARCEVDENVHIKRINIDTWLQYINTRSTEFRVTSAAHENYTCKCVANPTRNGVAHSFTGICSAWLSHTWYANLARLKRICREFPVETHIFVGKMLILLGKFLLLEHPTVQIVCVRVH